MPFDFAAFWVFVIMLVLLSLAVLRDPSQTTIDERIFESAAAAPGAANAVA
jgi:hypothetical protein